VKSSKQPHVRLPSDIAQELGLPGQLIVEKTAGGVLLRASKLSWEETARQMAESDEDWSAFDVTVAEGLNGNH